MNGRSLRPVVLLALLLGAEVAHADVSACNSARSKPSLEDKIRLYTICLTNGQMRRADLAGAFYHRAYAFFRNGESEHALEDLTQSLKYDSQSVYPYYLRGFIHVSRRELELAEQDFT